MAGELIVKNGLRVSGSTIIVGSITATSITGSFSGSITSATSASYAATASVLLGSVTSASFASTASYWSGSVSNVNSASFAATSSFPWFQTGANIAYVGGNVGVGTTSPTTPLYISSSANTGLLIKTPNPTLQLTDASDTWYIQGVSGDRLRVTRGGSADLFTVKSNGDVGIGIGATAPSARLQVRGAGTTSATTAFRVENANASASLAVLGNGQTRITSEGAALYVEGAGISPFTQNIAEFRYAGNGNSLIIANISGKSGLTTSTNLDLNIDPNGTGATVFRSGKQVIFNNSNNNGIIALQNTGATGQTRLDFITGSTTVMSVSGSGNIGIGTTSPTNTLQVVGGITATSFTGSLSGSATNAVSASFSSTASFYGGSVTSASFASTASSVNALSQSVLISGSLRALTVEPTNLSTNYFPKKSGTFLTSSVLNSNDDVTLNWGPATIVPTTPNSRELYIWGLNYASLVLRVSGSTGNDGYTMQARPGGNFAFSNIANNTQIFTLGSDVAVTALSILGAGGSIGMGQSGGSVGINWPNIYTIPAKFYVSGSVRFDGATTINGTGTTSATTAFTVKNANASSSLVVRDDRRVGINTATPGATLEVNGNMIITGSIDLRNSGGIRLYDSNGFGGGAIVGSYGYAAGEIYIQPLNGNGSNFIFSPTNGMSIGGFTIGGTIGSPPAYGLAVSGSVGIGTRLPAFKLDVSGSGRFTNGLTVTGSVIGTSFTGSLSGSATNAVSASFATTASYWSGSILNATSASFASTASFYGGSVTSASFALTASRVNTLNQNVIITGSLAVGSTALGSSENTIAVGPPPAAGAGEGGQILLAAAGGAYTSASMLDTYQDQFRVLRGTNAGSDGFKFQVNLDSGQVQIPNYNSPTAFPGAPVNSLATDNNGNVLTVQGYTGIVTINTMPPVNFDIQNGIIVNVF